MSLLHTESFMAYARAANADETYTTDNTAMRNGYTAALKRAGYMVYGGDQTSASQGTALIVRPDPVEPTRAALVFSSSANAFQRGVAAAIGAKLVQTGAVVVGGFSLYIPAEYSFQAVGGANPQLVFALGATYAGDTNWYNINGGNKEIMRVLSDGLIRWAGDAPQSTKALIPGRIQYIEYRIADNEVRVWIDDVLVLQKAVSVPPEMIVIMFNQVTVNAPATYLANLPGRWAISNWYNLTEDARAPNVRLGPTTRVIGTRPNNDVDVDFARPTAATSNAQVAGQDIVDQPNMSLQSSTAGDMDIYSTSTDTATASGKLVHAVVTKVLASNLESNPHSLRPLVVAQGGGEKEDPKTRQFVALAALPSTKAMYSIAQRPTDGKVFIAGIGPTVIASAPAADATTTQWTQVQDEGSASVWGLVCFRSDGTGYVLRSDYKVQVIPAGSDIPGAPITIAAVNGSTPNCLEVLPDNTIIVGGGNGRVWRCAGNLDPAVAANWTLQTAAAVSFGSMWYHPTLNRLVGFAAATSVYTSDDKGLTWTARANGLASTPSASVTVNEMSFDGNWFTIMMQNTTTAGYIRRSQDGISWSSPTYSTNGSSQGVINFAFAGSISGVTLFRNQVVSNGVLTSTDGGANWRMQSGGFMIGTAYAACELLNGDWFIVGTNGMLAAYTSVLVDTPLVPLVGYTMAFSSATTNPDTGAAWTPAEAAAAKFGMRVTS
jgi:hypothetical protein